MRCSYYKIIMSSQSTLAFSPSCADAEGLVSREEGDDHSVVETRGVWGRQGSTGAGLMTASSAALGSTPDRLHQTHRWWSCRVILLPPFRTFSARNLSCRSSCFIFIDHSVDGQWDYYYYFFFQSSRLLSDRPEVHFYFPGEKKSVQEWTDAASLVNTRNGCHRINIAKTGSFLDTIFAFLTIKHQPNPGL